MVAGNGTGSDTTDASGPEDPMLVIVCGVALGVLLVVVGTVVCVTFLCARIKARRTHHCHNIVHRKPASPMENSTTIFGNDGNVRTQVSTPEALEQQRASCPVRHQVSTGRRVGASQHVAVETMHFDLHTPAADIRAPKGNNKGESENEEEVVGRYIREGGSRQRVTRGYCVVEGEGGGKITEMGQKHMPQRPWEDEEGESRDNKTSESEREYSDLAGYKNRVDEHLGQPLSEFVFEDGSPLQDYPPSTDLEVESDEEVDNYRAHIMGRWDIYGSQTELPTCTSDRREDGKRLSGSHSSRYDSPSEGNVMPPEVEIQPLLPIPALVVHDTGMVDGNSGRPSPSEGLSSLSPSLSLIEAEENLDQSLSDLIALAEALETEEEELSSVVHDEPAAASEYILPTSGRGNILQVPSLKYHDHGSRITAV